MEPNYHSLPRVYGSTFYGLPLWSPENASGNHSCTETVDEPVTVIKILLVDDNQSFLKAATAFLTGLDGVNVVGGATSAAEGLARASASVPDLVLMDAVMPGMNGFDAVNQLKQTASTSKAVILTLHNNDAYRAVAASVGADGFIPKDDFVTELPPLLDVLFPDRRQ